MHRINEALTGLEAGVSREITPKHNPPSHKGFRFRQGFSVTNHAEVFNEGGRRGSCRFYPRAKNSGFAATANSYR